MKGHRAATTIYLRPEVLKALQEFSRKRDISMAQFLREAVDDLLAKHNVPVSKTRPRK
jgi:predicted transcriptional regulator